MTNKQLAQKFMAKLMGIVQFANATGVYDGVAQWLIDLLDERDQLARPSQKGLEEIFSISQDLCEEFKLRGSINAGQIFQLFKWLETLQGLVGFQSMLIWDLQQESEAYERGRLEERQRIMMLLGKSKFPSQKQGDYSFLELARWIDDIKDEIRVKVQ